MNDISLLLSSFSRIGAIVTFFFLLSKRAEPTLRYQTSTTSLLSLDPEDASMKRHADRQTDRRSVWQQIVDRSCRGGPGSQQDTKTDRSPRPDRSAALPLSSSSAAVNSRFYLSSPSASRYLLTSDLEPTISCIPDLSPFTSAGHGQCPAIYQSVFSVPLTGIPIIIQSSNE